MKRISFIIILSVFLINKAQSQGDGGISTLIVLLSQRSTILYTDTVFEIDQLKFKEPKLMLLEIRLKLLLH